MTYIQHTLGSIILPWLNERSSVEALLKLYWQDPSRIGNGLYFGDEPHCHWAVAQLYRDRKDARRERDALRNLILSPQSGNLFEAASARLRQLE